MASQPSPPIPTLPRTVLAAVPAPVAVVLQLVVYSMGWPCTDGLPIALHAVSLLALLLALAAAVMSWRTLQHADAAWQATSTSSATQARFIALGTTSLSVICVAIVLLNWSLPFMAGCG